MWRGEEERMIDSPINKMGDFAIPIAWVKRDDKGFISLKYSNEAVLQKNTPFTHVNMKVGSVTDPPTFPARVWYVG